MLDFLKFSVPKLAVISNLYLREFLLLALAILAISH